MRRLNPKHRATFVALLTEHSQAEVDGTPELYFDETIDFQSDSDAFALVAETDDGWILGAIVAEPDSDADEKQLDGHSSDHINDIDDIDDIDNAIVIDRGTADVELLVTGGSTEVRRGFRNSLAASCHRVSTGSTTDCSWRPAAGNSR